MLKEYFSHRNYSLLYLNVIGDSFVESFISIFAGAYLFSNGMPLHFILLFFGLEFGLRGIFSPLGPIIAAKIGMFRTMLICYLSLFCFFMVIGQAGHALTLAFFSFIFESFARALYYPLMTTLRAHIIPDGIRGRQKSIEIILVALSGLAGIALSTWALSIGSLLLLYSGMGLALLVALLPFLFFIHLPPIPPSRYKTVYVYLASGENRENLLPAFGYQLVIIANALIAPFYIFQVIGGFKVYGLVMGFSVVLQTLIPFIFGRLVDKKGGVRMRTFSALCLAPGNILILAISGPLSAFLVESWNKISWQMFQSVTDTVVEEKTLKSSDPFSFGAAFEMALCFSELVVLGLFAAFAYFWHDLIFPVVFLSSIGGIFLTVKYFRK